MRAMIKQNKTKQRTKRMQGHSKQTRSFKPESSLFECLLLQTVNPGPSSVPHMHVSKWANHIRTKKSVLCLAVIGSLMTLHRSEPPGGTERVECRPPGFAAMALVMEKSKCRHNLSRLGPSQHPAKYQSNL